MSAVPDPAAAARVAVRCNACQKKFALPAKYAGQTVRCPGCKAPLAVPAAAVPAAGAAPAVTGDTAATAATGAGTEWSRKTGPGLGSKAGSFSAEDAWDDDAPQKRPREDLARRVSRAKYNRPDPAPAQRSAYSSYLMIRLIGGAMVLAVTGIGALFNKCKTSSGSATVPGSYASAGVTAPSLSPYQSGIADGGEHLQELHDSITLDQLKTAHTQAQAAYQRALMDRPGDPTATKQLAVLKQAATSITHFEAAEKLAEAEKWDEAEKEYAAACDAYDRVPLYWYMQVTMVLNREQPQAAQGVCDRGLKANPGDGLLVAAHGQILMAQDQYAAAMQEFTLATQKEPNLDLGWYGWGKALYKLQRYDEALAKLAQAEKLNDGDSSTWFVHGMVLMKLKRFPEAAAKFKKSTELQPNIASYWFLYATALDGANRKAEALAAATKAAKVDPADEDIRSYLKQLQDDAGAPGTGR